MSAKKLTVNVITYNHEKYIAQCLDSILTQKTDFDYIVRIFDDASKDNTQEICKKYKEKYPDKIELHLAEENLGRLKDGTLINALRSYDNIETPYYIFIEGDDYCKGNKSFEKQARILEKHKNCICCCGRVQTYSENEKCFIGTTQYQRKIFSKNNARNNKEYFHVQHSGKMVRTNAIHIDKENPIFFLFDITQMYELLKYGDIYYINDIVSVYRLTSNNPDSIYASLSYEKQCKMLIDYYTKYNKYTNEEFAINLFNNMLIELAGKYYHQFEIQKENKKSKLFLKIKKIKHYFIPRFLLDIFDLPRDIIRIAKKHIAFIKKEYQNEKI